MAWTSMLAIYFLVWVLSAFLVLPFHGRRAEEQVSVAGADPGAPANFRPALVAWQVTILATIVFFLVVSALLARLD